MKENQKTKSPRRLSKKETLKSVTDRIGADLERAHREYDPRINYHEGDPLKGLGKK
jgi:hypothetical protein